MINELHAALRKKRSLDVTTKMLKGLNQYVHFHFREEERLMEAAKFPGLERQKTAHRLFLEKVASLQKRWESGDRSVSVEMMDLLQNWLVKHIQVMDREYGPSLTKKKN